MMNITKTKRLPNERIIQIIPAGGWWAKYRDGDRIDLWPLLCLALVETKEPDGTMTETVRGLDADSTGSTEFADAASNFDGLIHESNSQFGELRSGLPRV